MTFTTDITRPTHLWIFSFGRWYIFSTFYTTTTSCCQSCTLGFRGPNNRGKCILLITIFNIYTSFVTWVCFNFTCYFGSFRFCLSDIRKFNMLKMVQFSIILLQSVHRVIRFRRWYLLFCILLHSQTEISSVHFTEGYRATDIWSNTC